MRARYLPRVLLSDSAPLRMSWSTGVYWLCCFGFALGSGGGGDADGCDGSVR